MTSQADRFPLCVNGTLMRGGVLHRNLDGATFLAEVWTAPIYRLYSINDRHPGMFRVPLGGVAVRGELYDVTAAVWEQVAAHEPANLYRGPVELSDGRTVDGILYPRHLAEGKHRDISELGDWREYSKTLSRGNGGQ